MASPAAVLPPPFFPRSETGRAVEAQPARPSPRAPVLALPLLPPTAHSPRRSPLLRWPLTGRPLLHPRPVLPPHCSPLSLTSGPFGPVFSPFVAAISLSSCPARPVAPQPRFFRPAPRAAQLLPCRFHFEHAAALVTPACIQKEEEHVSSALVGAIACQAGTADGTRKPVRQHAILFCDTIDSSSPTR